MIQACEQRPEDDEVVFPILPWFDEGQAA